MTRRRGVLLVELIVVVVIISILAVVYLRVSGGRKTSAASSPGAALQKAHGVECASNINQSRALLQMNSMEDGTYPAVLDPNESLNRCPVSGKPYWYDPQTGRVQCITPGHEKF